ncbi:serine/threonine protein kinase [Priestia megaterium]|nr:serine/threonine protein kinase [Priestia megaterium]
MQAPILSVSDVYEIMESHSQNIIEDIEFLSTGGQKIVFKCKIDKVPYTLKFLEIESKETEGTTDEDDTGIESEVLARASREIDIMNQCDTPTLVKLGPIGLNIVSFDEKKLLMFSEEYIDGEDLHTILLNRKLSEKEALNLAINISDAIDHLWNIGMVHRDIKPKNIMQNKNGDFILLDTGIAFDTQGKALTQASLIIGTAIYMSPEQITNVKINIDFRSDLFLLGIVLYQALTGSHPFYKQGVNTMQIIANIMEAQFTPIENLRSGINKRFSRIITRLLSRHPHMRFKSCENLIDMLTKLKEEI